MAAEIKITLPTISYLKGPIAINITPPINPVLIDVAGENSMHDVFSLSTTDATLSKGNISSIGYVYIKNLDLAINILVGSDGINYFLTFKPGEYGVFRWNLGTGVHAKSASGTPLIEYCMIEL